MAGRKLPIRASLFCTCLTRRAAELGPNAEMRPKLLFDLSEVLIAGLYGIEHVIAQTASMPPEKIVEVVSGPHLWSLFKGEITEGEYLTRILSEGGWQRMDAAGLSRAMTTLFRAGVAGMPELVKDLSRECDLYLLSDHAREWIPSVEAWHPFLSLFMKRYYSFALGSVKREGRPFRLVLDDLRIQASEIFFVDDSAANVARAREHGIEATVFQGRSTLEPQLNAWIRRRRGGPA